MRSLLLFVCCAPALARAQVIDPALLKQDLRILRSALEEGHPGIYRYTPKEKLDHIFDDAANRLKRPMTSLDFYRVLSPAVAVLECGHTSLQVSDETEKAMAASIPLIPIEARILGRKIYVFRDYSQASGLAGTEIRSINGVSAARILQTMLLSIHGDGDTPTAGPWQIGHRRTFARELYALLGLESPFRIHHARAGRTAETTIEGLPGAKIEEAAKNRHPQDGRPSVAATYQLLNDGSVGVLKVHGFGGNAQGDKPLGEFIQEVYNDLNYRKVPNLIIYVRDNGGGADELGKQLFSYLVTEPFPYYKDLVIRKLSFDLFRYALNPRPIPEERVQKRPNGEYLMASHPNWGTQQPGKPHFGGKVFALMNGGSFSTTCEFLSTLHNHHRATFIGEEAAGGYYGNTSGPGALLVLPNSKLRLRVRLMTYYMAIEGTRYGNRSIPPDVAVSYSIEELLAGKDKELEMALRLIAGPVQEGKGVKQ